MADIRKITLLAGERDSLYEIGNKLTRGGRVFTIESMYPTTLDFENMEVPIVRILVVESDTAFVDIPYHAISRIFYS